MSRNIDSDPIKLILRKMQRDLKKDLRQLRRLGADESILFFKRYKDFVERIGNRLKE
ncbi:MAG: hypothetical protein ACTSWN_00160 [Promethearchaeota archaeon]